MNTTSKQYDVIIIGAGPGGIYSAYELHKQMPLLSIAVFEAGHVLWERKCPIDGEKIKTCIKCRPCAIMNGFGGAGAFSDGKYNITNDFGGTLYEYIGRKEALALMPYVDEINCEFGGSVTKHDLQEEVHAEWGDASGCVGAASGYGHQLYCAWQSLRAAEGCGGFLFRHPGGAGGCAV